MREFWLFMAAITIFSNSAGNDRFWPKPAIVKPSFAQREGFMVAMSVATIAGALRLNADSVAVISGLRLPLDADNSGRKSR